MKEIRPKASTDVRKVETKYGCSTFLTPSVFQTKYGCRCFLAPRSLFADAEVEYSEGSQQGPTAVVFIPWATPRYFFSVLRQKNSWNRTNSLHSKLNRMKSWCRALAIPCVQSDRASRFAQDSPGLCSLSQCNYKTHSST